MAPETRRMQLHKMLLDIVGTNNVYFQPPSTVKMKYPCIRYSLSADSPKYADNMAYLNRDKYTVMVIDPHAESRLRHEVRKLPLCSLKNAYTADNLHHFVFDLYF